MDKVLPPPQSLLEAVRFFKDPDICLAFMAQLRWPDGVVTCPRCGGTAVSFLSTRRLWECKTKHERRQFSIKVGTIFEDSPIPLDKWLAAVWLIVNCKNGISSYELARDLKVGQKTAWFMLHRIRLAMQTGTFERLGGDGKTVEVDESWIGGKARSMNNARRGKTATKRGARGPRAYTGKAIVLGMLERGGRVALKHVADVKRRTLEPHIHKHVAKGTEIHTDANLSYDRLDWINRETLEPDYQHKVVDHAVEYVHGNVHTNSLENFWSLLK